MAETLLRTDAILYVDTTNNDETIVLYDPSIEGYSGVKHHIKNIGANTLTISGVAAGVTIDGETTQTVEQYECICITNDGTDFWII